MAPLPPPPSASFAELLRRHRAAAGLSQQELAEAAGMSVNAVSALERGTRSKPYPHTVRALAAALRLDEAGMAALIAAARGTGGDQPEAAPEPEPAQLPRLPQPLTPFVGREAELARIAALLEDDAVRLVTLTGLGGAGKTRLALEAARRSPRRAAHISLVAVQDAAHVLPALATAFGLPARDLGQLRAQVLFLLSGPPALLVLDNVEQLAGQEAFDAILADLLNAAPALKLLLTSRMALQTSYEWVFDVGGLGADAAGYFVRAAQRVAAGWEPDPAQAAEVDRICALTEGMPLALDLAAGWMRVLGCREIADELSTRVDMLRSEARGIDPRHRSMTAVLDAMWRRLDAQESRAMTWLAVFRGGFDRAAAMQVAGVGLPLLAALAAKSLVHLGRDGRHALHELVRQHAEAREGAAEARAAHAAYFARFADDETQDPMRWFAAVQREEANILSAMQWLINGPQLELAARMCGTLWRYWLRNSATWSQGLALARRVQQGVAAAQPPLPALAQAQAGMCLGCLQLWEDGAAASIEMLQTSTRLARAAQGPGASVLAGALSNLGWVQMRVGQLDLALASLEESIALYRGLQDRWGLAYTLRGLRIVLDELGRRDDASAAVREAIVLWREIGDEWGLSLAQGSEAEALRLQGRVAEADLFYAECIAGQRRANGLFTVSMSLSNRAHAQAVMGDLDGAAASAREAAELALRMNSPYLIALASLATSHVFKARGGDASLGAALLDAGEATQQQIGFKFAEVDLNEVLHLRAHYAHVPDDVRKREALMGGELLARAVARL